MHIAEFVPHDQFGVFIHDHHQLPLVRLRERRRELVLALAESTSSLSRDIIREISEVQQAIKAVEAVIVE